MSIFNKQNRQPAQSIGSLTFINPFLERRIETERTILGGEFVPLQTVWNVEPSVTSDNENVRRIRVLAEEIARGARENLVLGKSPTGDELEIYERLIQYVVYYRYEESFYDYIIALTGAGNSTAKAPSFSKFKSETEYFFDFSPIKSELQYSKEHLFALLFQLRRAFHYTFRHILGGSLAAAKLRAAAWQSIVTHDVRRYMRSLYDQMHSLTTLITGPSGTGKELVASAIGLSRYIPFDPKTGTFTEDFRDTFHPLNLSAIAPTLIESELFGHCKGAFTGATSQSHGFLDNKGPFHTVFLDEIGDVDTSIQVKLLRVLQSREFYRVGDRVPRHFGGKIIAATNQSLADEIQAGRFRSDLYYRLCSDIIETAPLKDQVRDDPDGLRSIIAQIARRLIDDTECEAIADNVFDWIQESLGPAYPWPGNVRELEQCVHNFLVRGEYHPLIQSSVSPLEHLVDDFKAGRLGVDELVSSYITVVYSKAGQLQQTARKVGLDRRTVKARLDLELLKKLKSE
ncbi:MAG: sigma-54-dependent Fis family transcriptional regulator [Deltaproteobacteria bacterium]|nr:sigma-54-dependent Fis family transcriptional regulator [Deltaproteobacteria bacterium]